MNTRTSSHRLAVAGLAAVALHVIDDAFVQPQPGTGPGDHLSSGLIPLLLLALAVRSYPRVRAGSRAAIALIGAFFALLAGIEAIYYSSHGGLQGDDYTGVVALAAAPLLAGLGARELWQSRRRGDRHLRRYTRRSLKTAGIVVGVGMFALPIAVAYVGGHVARAEVPVLQTPHEDVTLHTDDGLTLRGWYIPSRNGAAVIVFPGRKGPLGRARMLARHGYGVLLYDRRGEGQSDGDPDGFGWNFNRDIRAGIDFLKRRADVDPQRIGGIGLSVGGEMMLQTASETTDLGAIVAEGAGGRTAAEEVTDTEGFDKVLAAVGYGARDLVNAVQQQTLPPTHLNKLVGKIKRPVFFIHAGKRDVGQLGPGYYRRAHEPKFIWQAKGGHTKAFDVEPREYERRVVSFFDAALLRPGTSPQGVRYPQE